jgi:hypothetical protein
MGVSLQTVVDRLNVHSFADITLNWMEERSLITNPLKNPSIDSAIQIIARVAGAYFFYPRISKPGALINGSLGVVHLTLGMVQRFRATEKVDWDAIALQIHKGFAHIFAGLYDFSTGYVLSRQFHLMAVAVALFAFFPEETLQLHRKMYHVFVQPSIEPEKQTNWFSKATGTFRTKLGLQAAIEAPQQDASEAKIIEINAIISAVKSLSADDMSQKVPEILTSVLSALPEKEPQKQEAPKYLSKTCLIYRAARSTTLWIMPKIEDPTSPKVDDPAHKIWSTFKL